MKKILFGLIIMFAATLVSCESCCKKNQGDSTDTTAVDQTKLDFNRLVSTDRQEMFTKYGEDYRWFETCMKLENFLDEENDGTLEEVVNVFQSVIERGSGFDTKVHKFQHFADGTNAVDSVDGFWVEDEPLNEETIKLSYEQAFEKLMEANITKPHSRYVTLRKQVGPVDANAQYIFGNIHETVFVDAVTGEVRSYNPAFGPNFRTGMPLGEWP